MDCGVFTSPRLEIALSGCWALCFYCDDGKSLLGARLYNGAPGSLTLAAVCERHNDREETVYAFERPDGQKRTNASGGEIVLEGCDGDEYVYRRDQPKSEYFKVRTHLSVLV